MSTPCQKLEKKWIFDKSWRGRGSQNILSKIESLYFVWFITLSIPLYPRRTLFCMIIYSVCTPAPDPQKVIGVIENVSFKAYTLRSFVFLIHFSSWVNVLQFKLFDIFRIYSCHFKWTHIHAVSLRILLSVIFTKNLSVRKSIVDWMKGGWWNWSSKYITFPLRERSERVGLSLCVKHGHVVQSTNCCWPVLGNGHGYS